MLFVPVQLCESNTLRTILVDVDVADVGVGVIERCCCCSVGVVCVLEKCSSWCV